MIARRLKWEIPLRALRTKCANITLVLSKSATTPARALSADLEVKVGRVPLGLRCPFEQTLVTPRSVQIDQGSPVGKRSCRLQKKILEQSHAWKNGRVIQHGFLWIPLKCGVKLQELISRGCCDLR